MGHISTIKNSSKNSSCHDKTLLQEINGVLNWFLAFIYIGWINDQYRNQWRNVFGYFWSTVNTLMGQPIRKCRTSANECIVKAALRLHKKGSHDSWTVPHLRGTNDFQTTATTTVLTLSHKLKVSLTGNDINLQIEQKTSIRSRIWWNRRTNDENLKQNVGSVNSSILI